MIKPARLFIALTVLGTACLSPGASSPPGAPAVAGDAGAPGKTDQPLPGPSEPPPEVVHLDHLRLRDGQVKTGRNIVCRDDEIFMTSGDVERAYDADAVNTIESASKDPALWLSVMELALWKGNGRLAFDAAVHGQLLPGPKASFVAVLQAPNFSRLAISLQVQDGTVATQRKDRDAAAAYRDGIAARIQATEQDMDNITAAINSRLGYLHPHTRADQVALLNDVAYERAILQELAEANARLQPLDAQLAAAVKERDETEAKLREACAATWTLVFGPPAQREEK